MTILCTSSTYTMRLEGRLKKKKKEKEQKYTSLVFGCLVVGVIPKLMYRARK